MHHSLSVSTNNGTAIDDAEDLDLVMPMCDLLEYSSNYFDTTDSLWFCSKDEATRFNGDIENNFIFKSSMYKTKLLEDAAAQPAPDYGNGFLKNAAVAVPLKYLCNFCRSLEMPLINYNVELKFIWTKHCILAVAGNDNSDADPDNIIFITNDSKVCVTVVTLSAKDNQKLSKLFIHGFEKLVFWNECKTRCENKNTAKEHRYFLESNFVRVSRFFVFVHSN